MAMRAEIASPVSKGVTISAGKVINPYLNPNLNLSIIDFSFWIF